MAHSIKAGYCSANNGVVQKLQDSLNNSCIWTYSMNRSDMVLLLLSELASDNSVNAAVH